MDPLQVTILTQGMRNEQARSALPGAPVVPEQPARLARSRTAAAGLLRRVADVVAPAHEATRPTLTTGRGNRLIRWDESPCRPSPTASA
jgi:hypothetical protein